MRVPAFGRRFGASLAIAFAAFMGAASSARADAIDGEWYREGRNFKIEGPNILTCGGTQMTGDYNRHGFRYTVPAREPEAGTEIVMQLRGEELLDLFRKPKGVTSESPAESWRRCRVTS